MKYLGLFFMVGFMWCTWNIVQTPGGMDEATHMSIQQEFKRAIGEYIQKKVPTATELTFTKFWTQNISANQIKVTFSYHFNELRGARSEAADADTDTKSAKSSSTPSPESKTEEVTIEVSGYGILTRVTSDNQEYDMWKLEDLFVEDNRVTFSEGLLINPNSPSEEE